MGLSVAGKGVALIIRAVFSSLICNHLRRAGARSLAMLAAAWLGHGGARAEQRTLPDLDKRRPAEAAAVAPEKAAAATALRARLRGARVELEAGADAPEFVGSPHEFLTGPAGVGRAVPPARVQARPAGEAHRELKAFLEEYRALFGHGAEALAGAPVKRDYTNAHNGLRSVVWQQQVAGVPVFGALLQSHVTRRGELVNVASHFLPDPAAAATRGTPRRAALLAAPTISAREAVAVAARNIGEAVQAADITPQDAPADAEKRQGFHAAALRGATAHFTWLPMEKGSARLCWEVVLTGRKTGEMFRTLVDAETGETHLRHCLTNYISEATYRVFTGDSPTPTLPSLAVPATTQAPEVSRTLVTLSAENITASPNGWIDDGVNETRGNNVDAHLDLDANNTPDTPRPQGSPNRVFDFPLDLTLQPSTYRDAAVTQLFYWCNWMHDKLYALGFTEAAGNFQTNNFGRGGAGNDPVQADAQDGSGTDNANFSVPGDGAPGRMQMYTFSAPSPGRDGDLDATVIIHEYGHGLSNRLVGGGGGISATVSMGMGEGWSDFYALALLSKEGDDPNANYIVGGYVTKGFNGLTQNHYYGIRRFPYTTDLAKNPLTFKDIDPVQASGHAGVPRSPAIGNTANEVHNMGEVWCVLLWEARTSLVAKHGFAGNQLMLQLVTDGMKLSPSNPNFIQARDAIIQADLVNNAGANKAELWAAFAKRGLGASATAPGSSTTVGLSEAYDLPDDLGITPNTGLASSGPVGGPFTVTSKTFTLKNNGAAALAWTAAAPAWLTLSASSGSLAPAATSSVTATLNANASALPKSINEDQIAFTNTVSARTLTRTASLYVGQPDRFTELFDASSPNDTANKTFTFTPDTSDALYAVTRIAATAFPSDTSAGTLIPLTDDSNALVTLTGGASVQLYGTGYTSFYVGSNGYLTFGEGDIEWAESYAAHFNLPRISALFRDLDPTSRGSIRRLQFADRIAVTWQAVPEYGANFLNSNNFQIELFFDGRIRITILAKSSTKSLIGLSRGLGFPAGFVKSDFSTYPAPAIAMTLPASSGEGAGVLTNQGVITLAQPTAAALTVALVSSNPAAVTVPASVIVPAGQTTVTFSPTVIDDTKINGTHTATITATATGWLAANQSISIADNENTNLALTLANVAEGGTAAGTVAISGTLPASLSVTLVSDNAARLGVPATVTIPAGSTSAGFTATGVENALTDGTVSVAVTASATGFTAASANSVVFDNDVHHFVLSAIGGVQLRGLPFSVTITAVNVDGALLPGVGGPVTLSASGGVAITPATATLAAGTATVAVTAGDFGSAVALSVADGGSHSGASNFFDVTYGPLHHFGWAALGSVPPIIGLPFPVTITALDVAENVAAAFTGTAALDCGTPTDRTIPLTPVTTGSFVAGVWTGSLAVGQIIDAVTLRATSGAASGETALFDVTQPVLAVTPAGGLTASGHFGGPFTPAAQDYVLTNSGNGLLAWSVMKDVPWLALSAAGGTLAPGASVTVSVSLDAAATDPGGYAGSVTFTNAANALGSTTRPAALTVGLPAPVLAPLPMFSGGTSRAVAWNAVAGAQTYEAQRSPDPGFATPATSGLIAATGHTFTGLGDGPHFYRVRARRVSGGQTFLSPWSAVLTSHQSATGPAVIVTSARLTTAAVFTIDGLAYDPSGVQSVTVNGTAASTTDGFAHWTATVGLGAGNNIFVIDALNNSLATAGSSMTWNVFLATASSDFDHDGLADAWEVAHGLDLFDDTGLNGALADLSGNGVPNLLKYAFALDPYSPSLTGLPVTTIEPPAPASPRYLTLRYRRLLVRDPIQYVIEVSSDFLTWASAPADYEEIAPATPTGDGLSETVTIRVLPALETPAAPARFIRVRVVVP